MLAGALYTYMIRSKKLWVLGYSTVLALCTMKKEA